VKLGEYIKEYYENSLHNYYSCGTNNQNLHEISVSTEAKILKVEYSGSYQRKYAKYSPPLFNFILYLQIAHSYEFMKQEKYYGKNQYTWNIIPPGKIVM